MDSVLNTAELLDIILEYLRDDNFHFDRHRDVANARLVNWMWCKRSSAVYFKNCCDSKLDIVALNPDYSTLVQSVYTTSHRWRFSQLDLKNVIHLSIDDQIETNIHNARAKITQIHEKCPAVNKIELRAHLVSLAGYVPLCRNLYPGCNLDIGFHSAATGPEGFELESILQSLSEGNHRISIGFRCYLEDLLHSGDQLRLYDFKKLFKFPKALPSIYQLGLESCPQTFGQLVPYFVQVAPYLKTFSLNVDDGYVLHHENPRLADNILVALKGCNRLERLDLTFVHASPQDITEEWVGRLVDNTVSLQHLTLSVYGDNRVFRTGMLKQLKKCKTLQSISVANEEFGWGPGGVYSNPFGMDLNLSEMVQSDKDIWFPNLHTLELHANIDKSEFSKPHVAYHMPLLKVLKIKKPSL